MDMVTIQATLSGLKAAGEIAKGILALKSMTEVQGKVIELQSAILSAQSTALSAMGEHQVVLDENRKLKEELERVAAWSQQKRRYRLVSPWEGGLVYALRSQENHGEPAHWICTKCYEDGRRSILNPIHRPAEWVRYACPICKSEVISPWKSPVAAEYAVED